MNVSLSVVIAVLAGSGVLAGLGSPAPAARCRSLWRSTLPTLEA